MFVAKDRELWDAGTAPGTSGGPVLRKMPPRNLPGSQALLLSKAALPKLGLKLLSVTDQSLTCPRLDLAGDSQ